MKRLHIPIGATYGNGKLAVLRELDSKGKRRFLCKCVCGRTVEVRLDHLQSGHTYSCGQCGVEHDGENKKISQWAREKGIKRSTLRARLKIMGIGEALKR